MATSVTISNPQRTSQSPTSPQGPRLADLDLETLQRLAAILDALCPLPALDGPVNPSGNDLHALNHAIGRRSVYKDVLHTIASRRQQETQRVRKKR